MLYQLSYFRIMFKMSILLFRAENETRTRDPNLGKVMLYQLSYFRNFLINRLLFSRLRVQRYSFFLKLPKQLITFFIRFYPFFPE